MSLFGYDNTITESATFIGTNGSMGFKNGTSYRLEISIEHGKIVVTDCRNGRIIPYDTMSALSKNWDFRKP